MLLRIFGSENTVVLDVLLIAEKTTCQMVKQGKGLVTSWRNEQLWCIEVYFRSGSYNGIGQQLGFIRGKCGIGFKNFLIQLFTVAEMVGTSVLSSKGLNVTLYMKNV